MLPNYSYSPSNHFHLPNTPRFHGSHHTKPSVPVSVPYPHLYPIHYLYSHSPIHNSTNPVDKYGQNIANGNVMVSYNKLQHINCIISKNENKNENEGGLYIGGTIATLNPNIIYNNKIRAVLCCNSQASTNYTLYPQHSLIFKYLPIQDHQQFPISKYFQQSYIFIQQNRKQGYNVLVQCHGGASRSSTILIAYLMRKLNKGLKEVYQFVKEKRQRIKPNLGFWRQLQQYQAELGISNQGNININNTNKENQSHQSNKNQIVKDSMNQQIKKQQDIEQNKTLQTPKINKNLKISSASSKSVKNQLSSHKQRNENIRYLQDPQKQSHKSKSSSKQQVIQFEQSTNPYNISQQFSHFANYSTLPSSSTNTQSNLSLNSQPTKHPQQQVVSPHKIKHNIKPKQSINYNSSNININNHPNIMLYHHINPNPNQNPNQNMNINMNINMNTLYQNQQHIPSSHIYSNNYYQYLQPGQSVTMRSRAGTNQGQNYYRIY